MLNTIMRIQSAMTSLPFIQTAQEDLIREWLMQMLSPTNPSLENPNVRLSTTIDTSKVTCWATNDMALLRQQLLDLMEVSNFNEMESKALKVLTKDIPEGKLSSWLQLNEGGQETGWVIDGVFPLAEAFKLVPKGAIKDKLQAWYKSHEADACVRVGRSIASNRFAILHTELFGDSAIEDIQLYIDLMDELDLSPLPEALLELIANDRPEYIELAFSIGHNGIIKVGLVIPEPSEKLFHQLSLVYAEDAAESLAEFEGILGATAIKALQLSREASGIAIDLHY